MLKKFALTVPTYIQYVRGVSEIKFEYANKTKKIEDRELFF